MARRFRIRAKRKINIPRVVAKTAGTIIALYVGNEIITQVGSIMNCTAGPFNDGFKLIGWTISDSYNITDTTCASYDNANLVNNVITDTSGAGVLAVVGIVGIASIIMEFVEFNL